MNGVERARWREFLKEFYRSAPTLYVPPGDDRFHVVTARNQSTRPETLGWLRERHGLRVSEVFMLSVARTLENVVVFKSHTLLTTGVVDYAEDNRSVVRALRPLLPACRVWHFKRGKLVLDYEAPL
jgi:hypothetical protein